MGKVVRRSALVALVVVCLTILGACTSDGSDGESSFRNLGKRGDSDVATDQAALR